MVLSYQIQYAGFALDQDKEERLKPYEYVRDLILSCFFV